MTDVENVNIDYTNGTIGTNGLIGKSGIKDINDTNDSINGTNEINETTNGKNDVSNVSNETNDKNDPNVSNEKNGTIKNDFLQTIQAEELPSSLFSAIMLSYWDNVMGPVISKVWIGNDRFDINEDILNYVSNHTLSGELCMQNERSTIDPKFYILADLGCIFCAFIFNGKTRMGMTVSSLSFIMPYAALERYLLLQDLIGRHMKLLLLKYQVLQHRNLPTAVSDFSYYLTSFVQMMDDVEESNIKGSICVKETFFYEDGNTDMKLMDKKFLMRCLTSYLQTCGCAIVCGQSLGTVNKFVRTLSLFLSTNERYCSKVASKDDKCIWVQELFLQGILKNDNSTFTVPSIWRKNILLGSYPVTLIDIDKFTVTQTPNVCKHQAGRKAFLKVVLQSLLEGRDSPESKVANTFTENLFSDDIGDISVMVQKFVAELFDLPNKCKIRKNHITNFISSLHQKSKALLAYVESVSQSGKSPLDASQINQMKKDLLYTSDDDFRIVLAYAEKRQPGFIAFLDEEHGKVIRNLEAF